MATIVTAFMTNVNNIEFRSHEKYIELGKKLLMQSIPTICFLEKNIYDQYFRKQVSHFPLTIFKMFEKTENYLYEHESKLNPLELCTDNPTKDTVGYMFLQCHKTEWVKMAIDENPFNTSDFIWIDFGIFHMIKDNMCFASSLKKLSKKRFDKIRIASCIDPNLQCNNVNVYKQILWFFAGSIFGGNKESLIEFSRLMKRICIDMINDKKHIMWEVNIWYLLFQQHPKLFSPYNSNHDLSILENY